MSSKAQAIGEATTFPRGFSERTGWTWPLIPARDVVALNYGRALKAEDRRDGKVPVFGTNGQCGWHDVPQTMGPGLVLGRKGQGPLGVKWCATDFWVIDTAYYATVLRSDVDLKYLYYLIGYIGLNHLKDGTSNPTLSREVFGSQLLPIPSPSVQKTIVEVLEAYDDRIALLRETNATLEAIAQALFKSWFVDFNPVRAKSQGLAPAGMDEATAAFFPDGFEETRVGSIPRGWRVASIYEVAQVVYGAPFASSRFNTDGIGRPLVRIRDLRDEAPGVHTDEVHPKGYLLSPGDIVVGMDGEFRAYLWGGEEAWLNQRVCVFQPNVGVPAAFVSATIEPQLAHIEATETATTVIHLGKGDIDRFVALVPPGDVLAAFGAIVDPLYARIVTNKQTCRSLAALRDTLLPRLLSGQLRLPGAVESDAAMA